MGSCKKRGSVDVSSAADFDPGVYSASVCIKGQVCGGIAVYGGGGWNPSVGTSAASPFATAVLVRMGLGAKTNAEIYTSPTSFTDVTVGNNDPSKTCSDVMCNAGVGWDGPTGWGVPNGYTLAMFGGATPTAPTPPTCLAVTDGGAPSGDDDASTGDDDGGSGSGSSSGGSGSSSGGAGDDDDSGGGSGSSSGGLGGSSSGSSSGGLNDDGGTQSVNDGGATNGNNGNGSSSSGCSCIVGPGTSSAPEGLGLTAFASLVVLGLRRRRRSQ
jgi:MYXO-CTERM domain-containing protein